jgi:D-inositol-3-phosphate glycosyltransferase
VSSVCYEGFPMVCVEAMAHAKPVVVPDLGGFPEIVAHGVAGRVVPPADPDALAAALRDLWHHPERCRQLGRAGRARARTHYSRRAYVAGLLQLFAEARQYLR